MFNSLYDYRYLSAVSGNYQPKWDVIGISNEGHSPSQAGNVRFSPTVEEECDGISQELWRVSRWLGQPMQEVIFQLHHLQHHPEEAILINLLGKTITFQWILKHMHMGASHRCAMPAPSTKMSQMYWNTFDFPSDFLDALSLENPPPSPTGPFLKILHSNSVGTKIF